MVRVGLYPMCAENRRLERREDVLTKLQEEHEFLVGDVVDFSHYEQQELFLEGTGSMLLDRIVLPMQHYPYEQMLKF